MPHKPGKRERNEVESSDDSFITISKSDLRAEIQDIVKVAINEALEARVGDFQGIRENLDLLTSQIDRLSSTTDLLQKTLSEKEKEIGDLHESVNTLKKENCELLRQMNDLENYQRRDNLRISGIPEEASENPSKTVCDLLVKKGFNVKENDLHIVHRVGRKTSARPRAMIVRFFNRNTRNTVIRERRKLKGSGFVISEDVSILTMKTLMRIQKNEELNAWIWNGQVCARHKNGAEKTFVIKPFQSVTEARGN